MQLRESKQSSRRELPSAIEQLLYQRRSIREFTAEPVTRACLETVIAAATQAPSAMNEQPWCFTVVTAKKLLSEISRQAKAYALEEFGEGSHFDHVRQMLSDPRFDIFYGAPTLIVISASRDSAWAVEDCAMAAQNLMLAARAIGLGTCWIGFAQRWLNTDEGHAATGLADSQIAVAPVIIGHPKDRPAPVARRRPTIKWIA